MKIEEKIIEYINFNFGQILSQLKFPKQGMSGSVFFIKIEKLGEVVVKYGKHVDKDIYYLKLVKNELPEFKVPKVYGSFQLENIHVVVLEKINGKLFGEIEVYDLPNYFNSVMFTLNTLHKIRIENSDWKKYLLEIFENGNLNWEEIMSRKNLDKKLVQNTRNHLLGKIQATNFILNSYSLLHTDFNQSNLFVNEGTHEITGVIDWEEVAYGDRIYDFARFHLHLWHRGVSENIIDKFLESLNFNTEEQKREKLYFDIFVLHYLAYYSEMDDEFCRSRILMHENYLKKIN